MSWRDRVRTASFRGIDFKVADRSSSGGRRLATHEFPLRDTPYVEDLGRKARSFSVSAYLIGENYDLARKALVFALEQYGPGLYIDPWGSEYMVAVESYDFSDSRDQGRKGDVSISFVEAGQQRYPKSTIDTKSDVSLKADLALQIVEGDFKASFSLQGQPGFVQSAAVGLHLEVLQTAAQLNLAVSDTAEAISDFTDLLTVQRLNSTAMVRGDFAGGTIALIKAIARVAAPGETRVQALQGMSHYGKTLPEIPIATATRFRQAENQKAVINLVRRAALVEEARAVTDQQFASYDVALAAQTHFASRFEAEILAAGASVTGQQMDDAGYQALRALKAATLRDIIERGANLARFRTLELRDSQPALVVAYDAHEDAGRDGQITEINEVVHPGFVTDRHVRVLG